MVFDEKTYMFVGVTMPMHPIISVKKASLLVMASVAVLLLPKYSLGHPENSVVFIIRYIFTGRKYQKENQFNCKESFTGDGSHLVEVEVKIVAVAVQPSLLGLQILQQRDILWPGDGVHRLGIVGARGELAKDPRGRGHAEDGRSGAEHRDAAHAEVRNRLVLAPVARCRLFRGGRQATQGLL